MKEAHIQNETHIYTVYTQRTHLHFRSRQFPQYQQKQQQWQRRWQQTLWSQHTLLI